MSARESNQGSKTASIGVSQRRLWLFRILAVSLGPVLLGGLELGLRLFGYGYPTSFFLRRTINGQEYYVTNDRFARRFFPPALARTPVPLRMAARKPANTYRIFLFGESAAQGDPNPSFGAGRYLQALLRERYPGMNFEVVCAAMTAINSHAVLPIARECARRQGDLWIIYMGNNEMVGPFGASTVFGWRAPPVSLVRAILAVKTARTGQLVDQFLTGLMPRLGVHSPMPKIWSGLDMFKEHPLRYSDANRLRAYQNFRRNLADILRAGQDAGVPIVLSTVGSNLKDCAPFASLHSATLEPAQQSQWDGYLRDGIAFETAGSYEQAQNQFEQAATLDSRHAELRFRAGRCDLQLTNTTQALREFEAARDEDALAFRADDRINQIIREAADARAGGGVYFLDAAGMLARHSPAGIPGNELFYDHVHLNFAGNYLLGRAFAEQTAKLLPKPVPPRLMEEWAPPAVCDRALAVSPWDRYGVWMQSFSRVSEPPFTSQLNTAERARFYMSVLNELGGRMNEQTRGQSLQMYQDALARAPDDYFLHANFSDFLFAVDDPAAAIKEEQSVFDLLPQDPLAPLKIGMLRVRQGLIREAEQSFSSALKIRKDYVPALNELGVIWANRQHWIKAAQCFTQALRIDPGFVQSYLDWGFMEQCEGEMDPAVARYHEAAELQPSGPAGYFYQGVASARQHRRDEAVNYFQAAAYMKPTFWQASYLLGMELAAAGKLEQALARFSEAVRLRPDFARAHLNYGVALAKQGKLEAALQEFQVTLQLNPTNRIARQNLEAVRADIQAHKARGQ